LEEEPPRDNERVDSTVHGFLLRGLIGNSLEINKAVEEVFEVKVRQNPPFLPQIYILLEESFGE
jgi:hypothetical protein